MTSADLAASLLLMLLSTRRRSRRSRRRRPTQEAAPASVPGLAVARNEATVDFPEGSPSPSTPRPTTPSPTWSCIYRAPGVETWSVELPPFARGDDVAGHRAPGRPARGRPAAGGRRQLPLADHRGRRRRRRDARANAALGRRPLRLDAAERSQRDGLHLRAATPPSSRRSSTRRSGQSPVSPSRMARSWTSRSASGPTPTGTTSTARWRRTPSPGSPAPPTPRCISSWRSCRPATTTRWRASSRTRSATRCCTRPPRTRSTARRSGWTRGWPPTGRRAAATASTPTPWNSRRAARCLRCAR